MPETTEHLDGEIEQILIELINKVSPGSYKVKSREEAKSKLHSLLNRVRVEADLRGTLEAAKQIWSIYNAPSRIPGQKMFDFDKWLPGQIEDWENRLASLTETRGKS